MQLLKRALLFPSGAHAASGKTASAHGKYRPDIDGLRAVAVLSVMFFHLAPGSIRGGWVGVDVFFVISGFLITRLIRDHIEAGTFSFGAFYARRARRLFASFIVTVALTFVAARLIFDRGYWQHSAGEVVYALAAASNFYYWLDGGYFGLAEQYKPLLHTWSLGVEEQFYLIWPLTMVLTLRYARRYLWVVLASTFLVSLVLAEYYVAAGMDKATFFLAHGRIFEFCIGAMMVWLIDYQPANRYLSHIALTLGLGLILYSVLWFTSGMPFPGVYALVPCLGTALVIFGGTASSLRVILANKLAVGIGKISYSLYLVHWPLIVFYKYHRVAPLNHLEQAGISIAAIASAALMYTFIEQPFRDPTRVRFASRAALGLACTAATLVLLLPACIIWAKGTLRWGGPVLYVDAAELEQLEEGSKQHQLDAQVKEGEFAPDSGRRRIMVVGDSHSKDVAGALLLGLGADRYDVARMTFDDPCFSVRHAGPWITRVAGTTTECESEIEALKNNRAIAAADYVLIANKWTDETVKGFDEGLAFLRSLTTAKIVVVGQNASFPTFDTSLRFLDRSRMRGLNTLFYRERSQSDMQINEELRRLGSVHGLDFIDREPLVCSNATSQCAVSIGNGNFFYRDPSHWSYMGRALFGARMARQYGSLFVSAAEH